MTTYSITMLLDLRMGQGPYLPRGIFSSIRRQFIDYFGTRSSDGTRSLSPKRNLFVHETTNYRLLRYSISGWDKLPISKKDLSIHETTIDRLLRYSIFGGTCSPYPKRIFSRPWDDDKLFDYFGTRPSDGTSSLSLKRILVHEMTNYFDYFGTRSSDGTHSLSPKRIPSSMRRQLINHFGTRSSDGIFSPSPTRT